MSGSFGEMGNLLKQAQQMQRELDRAREELRQTVVEGSAGGGVVKVVASADGEVRALRIAPSALQGADAGMLEDLVLAAVRDALARASSAREERLGRVTGGIQLPGFL